ncbi:hypothetical protein GCM10022199_16700 [Marihabitans asiaticum]
MTTAGATSLAALMTALIAAYQVYLLRRQMRDDARPYVVADIVPSLHGPGAWDLTLHSTGRSAARRVRITTDPKSWTARDPDDHISEPLLAYLAREHEFPPGTRHRVMWQYAHKGTGQLSGAPSVVTVTVAYQDDRGKPFNESFAFDVGILGKVSPAAWGGPRKGASEDGNELNNIDRAIRTLSQHVGELRR